MSNAATSGGLETDPRNGASRTLSPDAIESILNDFRTWLNGLANGERAAAAEPRPDTVDLFALVGQFTALRHEVNMQTRAARTAVEQNAEVLKQLAAIQQPAETSDDLRPIAKGVIDIADALSLSLRQMEKFRDTAEPLLQGASAGPSPGFFARLMGSKPAEATPVPGMEKLRQLVAAAADGYAMSLRRVERLLPTLELETLECVGEEFDPEMMEAVEVVGDTGQPAGTVVEEVRPGYAWRGQVFRFAQVKVAR